MAQTTVCALDRRETFEKETAADVTDRIRTATETLYQELIDAEAAAFIGAAPFERTPDRVTQRNGARPRTLTTTAGELELRIPKLRQGSFFPSLLERGRRADQALFAVVMEAYVHGVSTRKVDDLVKALGADTGISKSEVSRICAHLDEDVAAFRDRPLADQGYPYVFLDATYCKARVGRRVVSRAVVVAVGVAADGSAQVETHHPRPDRHRPGRTQRRPGRAEPALGHRHHRAPHPRRKGLLLRRAGHLLPPRRGVVDRLLTDRSAGDKRARDGHRDPA